MEIGMISLGRMGMNMARRLLRGKHKVIAYKRSPSKTDEIVEEGAIAAAQQNRDAALTDLGASVRHDHVQMAIVIEMINGQRPGKGTDRPARGSGKGGPLLAGKDGEIAGAVQQDQIRPLVEIDVGNPKGANA